MTFGRLLRIVLALLTLLLVVGGFESGDWWLPVTVFTYGAAAFLVGVDFA